MRTISRAFSKVGAGLAVCAILGVALPRSAGADDRASAALREHAPEVMKYLQSRGYHTVGVLKFSVKKGDRAATPSAGPLNSRMAASLENALVLLNDAKSPINVLHDPGGAVSTLSRGATQRTAQGRRGLFAHVYPVPWDGLRKKPDAFLTGEVTLGKNMKTLSIVVQAFSAKTPEAIDVVLRIKDVPTSPEVLASAGQSFVLPRGLKHRLSRDLDEAAADDAAQRDSTGGNPLKDADSLVKLEIFYDDQPVALEADAGSPGEVRVRGSKAGDPNEGQKVKFVVTNVSSETVGVVLAVNGKSTLFRDDLTSKAPGECAKWILGPGEAYTISGFYTSEDGKEVHPFKVLSKEESDASELSGDQKGVFSLYAFRKVAADQTASLNISNEGGSDLARSPSPVGATGKRGLAEYQAAVVAATHARAVKGRLVAEPAVHRATPAKHARQKNSRGLVVEDSGSTSGSGLNRTDTKFDPQPAMSLSIRYHSGPTPEPAPAAE